MDKLSRLEKKPKKNKNQKTKFLQFVIEFTLHSISGHINRVPRFPHLCSGSNKAPLSEVF